MTEKKKTFLGYELVDLSELGFDLIAVDSWVGGPIRSKPGGTNNNDNIRSSSKALVDGMDGNDGITTGDGVDVVRGRNGDDTLNGGGGNDLLFGERHDDDLSGGAGNDVLFGGRGKDTLSGGADNDELYGGTRRDNLKGDSGNDELYGGAGKDRLFGVAGDDVLDGGAARDILTGGADDDFFVLDLDGARNEYDIVADWLTGADKIRVDTATGTETDIATLFANAQIGAATGVSRAALTIRGVKNGNQEDTAIYSLGADGIVGSTGDATLGRGDDVLLMVLVDWSDTLTISHFDIV